MGLFDKLRQRVEDTSAATDSKAFDFDSGFVYKLFGASTYVSPSLAANWGGREGYSVIYRSQAAVYTVVEFLATQCSGVGLKAYRRVSDSDRQELRNEPLSGLFGAPAPGLTYKRLIHQTVADRKVYGNAYWLKNRVGDLRSVVPLPAGNVEPRGGTVVQADSYRFTQGDRETEYPADRIVHFRAYNPDDPRIGVSPLEPLRSVLRSDAAALAHWENLWRNGARVGGWLQLPADAELSEEAMTRLRESLKQAYSGSKNAGKLGILEGGADFKEATWSPHEAEFIEGRKLTLETVARALNVPLAVLSLTESATYASQKEFHKQLYVDTLGPIFKEIEEELEASVVPWVYPDDSDIYVEFNVEEKLRGSFEDQATALRQAVGVPFLSVNEARALQNRPRVDDQEFDLPVRPSNVAYGDVQTPGEAPMPQERGLTAV